MLKYHIINLASCRLCPRRAAGGKERRYMDQNDKNKSNKNNDRRRGVLSLLIWALVLTIGFNYLLSAMDTRKLAESTCEIRYDEFLDLVRDGKVKEVEIADRTLNITPVDGFTYTDADGKTYSGDFQLFTTQINDPELRSFLDENGVEFGKPYKAETSYLEIIMLNYVLPTALMVGAFMLLMNFIAKKSGGMGGIGGIGNVGKCFYIYDSNNNVMPVLYDNMAVMRSAKAGYAEEAAADEPLDFKTIKLQYNVQAKFVLE